MNLIRTAVLQEITDAVCIFRPEKPKWTTFQTAVDGAETTRADGETTPLNFHYNLDHRNLALDPGTPSCGIFGLRQLRKGLKPLALCKPTTGCPV